MTASGAAPSLPARPHTARPLHGRRGWQRAPTAAPAMRQRGCRAPCPRRAPARPAWWGLWAMSVEAPQSPSEEGPPLTPHLQSRPVHVSGQLHADSVCDDEGVIGVDLGGRRASGGHARTRWEELGRADGVGRKVHTGVCLGHAFHRKSTTKGTFNLGRRGRKRSEVSAGGSPYLVFCKRRSRGHGAGEKAQGPIPEVEAPPPHLPTLPPAVSWPVRPSPSASPGAAGGGGSCPSQGETKSRRRAGGWSQAGSWTRHCLPCQAKPLRTLPASVYPRGVGLLVDVLLGRLRASRGLSPRL